MKKTVKCSEEMLEMPLIIASLALMLIPTCGIACYFPAELQGEFVMQSTVANSGSLVQYSQVNITAYSIPIWGYCHRRIGNNVILMDVSGNTNCIRCFHLNLRSKNVLQVRTEGLDKCYTKEEAAVATCPGEIISTSSTDHLKEVLLYKTKELGGEDIRKEYCPINGRYTFTYNVNEGSENKAECLDSVSELDNCPSASGLNLRFRRCSFEDHDITFECLGHWAAPGRQRYLALLDTRVGGDRRAQYRCALYQEDQSTGNIYMAFSSDSTCTSDLRSATEGFETMVIRSIPESRWPSRVESSSCRFPAWAQGRWEHLDIKDNGLVYKDHTTFKTSSARCIDAEASSGEKFLIFSRNQCGKEVYSCIWMKKRAPNVIEFQMGTRSSSFLNNSICSDSNFQDAWITQGKMDIEKESPCPITGEYTGFIPDASGLCAKLYSDCNNPEIMFYTVSECAVQPEVYEGGRMRIHGRLSRLRRQQRPHQIGTRVFHITNPRAMTQTSTSSVTTTDQTLITPLSSKVMVPSDVTVTSDQHRNQNLPPIVLPYNIPPPVKVHTLVSKENSQEGNVHSSHPLDGTKNKDDYPRLSAPPTVENPTVYDASSLSSTVTSYNNYAENPLAQYDNTGYVRRPVGYDGARNIPDPRYSSNSDSKSYHSYNSETTSTSYNNNNPGIGYHSRYSFTDMSGTSQQYPRDSSSDSSATTMPTEEEYDPWAFPKTHGHRPQSVNYAGRSTVDTRWIPDSRASSTPPTMYSPIPTVNYLNHPLNYNPPSSPPHNHPSPSSNSPFLFPNHPFTSQNSPSSNNNFPSPSPNNDNNYPSPSPFSYPSQNFVIQPLTTVSSRDFHPPVNYSISQQTFPSPSLTFPSHTRGRPLQFFTSPPEITSPPSRPSSTVIMYKTFSSPSRRLVPIDHETATSASRSNSPTKREEREYRCLGQWEEDGLMYTYTQRRDVGNSYECFVGSIKTNAEIFIKEAGEHCQRHMDPVRLGMKLTKRGEAGSCFGSDTTQTTPRISPPHPNPTTSWYSSKRPPEPTKPWKPITGTPREDVGSRAHSIHIYTVGTYLIVSLMWLLVSQ